MGPSMGKPKKKKEKKKGKLFPLPLCIFLLSKLLIMSELDLRERKLCKHRNPYMEMEQLRDINSN